MKFQAHITDDWQRDSLVIQVRQVNDHETTTGIAEAVEDTDGVPVLRVRPFDRDEYQRGEVTPGLRVRWDMAVAIGQAVIAHTKAPANPGDLALALDEVAALHLELRSSQEGHAAALRDAAAQRDRADMLERLVEAKEAHLDREARTSTVFVRALEMEQGKAEVSAERANHPARSIQDSINDSLTRVARTVKGN